MKYEPVVSVRPARDWSPLVIAAVAAAVCFYRLGTPAVYWWDEARIAVNSLEMLRHPSLVVTFHDKPDLWNTKPPLATWLNALSMAVFGVNEWALRLPSALAAIGTTVAVFAFTRRYTERLTGYLAALMLLGMGGFIEVHVARTADFDSLLVMSLTGATLSLFLAREDRRWYYAFATFLTLAAFTKGVAGFLMVPGYALCRWRDRRFWLALTVPLSLFALFLAARELMAPGYLQATMLQDFGRFNSPADGHIGRPFFYLRELLLPWQGILSKPMIEIPYVRSAFPWAWLVPLALIRRDHASTYLLVCLASFLVVISSASTQLGWYAAPAYPLIAILAAIGIYRLNSLVEGQFVFPLLFIVAVGCVGLNIWKIEKELGTRFTSIEQRQPNLLKSGKTIGPPEFTWRVLGQPYYGPLEFYHWQIITIPSPPLPPKLVADPVSAPPPPPPPQP